MASKQNSKADAARPRVGVIAKPDSAARTSTPRRHRVLLSLGAAGPVIFIATYLIDGATQPGYSSWHDSISTLSLAPRGWIQMASFVLYGLLTLCFAEGLRRSGSTKAGGFALLVVAGLCLIVIGPFRTDPVLGFPAGKSSTATLGGSIHNFSSLVVFLAYPAAVFVTTRRPFRGWAAYSVASGVLSLVAVAVFFAAVSAANGHAGGDSPAGVYERLPTLFIGLWQVALAIRVLRANPELRPGRHPSLPAIRHKLRETLATSKDGSNAGQGRHRHRQPFRRSPRTMAHDPLRGGGVPENG